MNRLKIEKRSEGLRLKNMRMQGVIPGIVYGQDLKNTPVAALRKDLNKATERPGEVYKVKVDDQTLYTKIENIQRDPLSREMLHFSLVQLPTGQESEVSVPIVLKGEPEGARKGGVLVHLKEELPVKGRPNSIPDQIEVDVSELDIGDRLEVEQIDLPKRVEIMDETSEVIAVCSPPLKPSENSESEEMEPSSAVS